MSSYHLTFEARKDLQEIHDFIAEDNPAAALRFINTIEDKCQALADSPEIGKKRDELALQLRSFPIRSYLIFYRIKDSAIEIIRILHGARDVESIFSD